MDVPNTINSLGFFLLGNYLISKVTLKIYLNLLFWKKNKNKNTEIGNDWKGEKCSLLYIEKIWMERIEYKESFWVGYLSFIFVLYKEKKQPFPNILPPNIKRKERRRKGKGFISLIVHHPII